MSTGSDGGGSSSAYELGGRYIHAKTRQPLTLRYIGRLPPSDTDTGTGAQWLGVEYDDASHGKGHSGTYEGVQVFQTVQRGAGAFIRVRTRDGRERELDRGKTLIEAIKERYELATTTATQTDNEGGGADSSTKQTAGQEVLLGKSGIVVTAPGLEDVHRRLKRLERIREIGLEDQFICGVGGADEAERQLFRKRLAGVTRLDISNNLLRSWSDTNDILASLPGLKTLIINGSRLGGPIETNNLDHLAQLKELHLARSLVQWDTVCRLAPSLSHLEDLHLDANPQILDLSSRPLTGLDKLRSLSLAECNIASWSTLYTVLSSLPSLESLNVSANPLSLDTTSPADAPVLDGLKSLMLLYSPITSLDALSALSHRVPSLRALKHSIDPSASPCDTLGLNGNAQEDRAALVAIFPQLILLNGTGVKPKERDEAERRLLAALPREHRLYGRLAQKQGVKAAEVTTPAVPAQPAKANNSLKSKLITLHVYDPEREAYPMTILPSAPATLLKRKIARKLALDMSTISIYTVRRKPSTIEAAGPAETDEVWTRDKVALVDEGEVGYWFDDGDGVIVET